MQVNHATNSTNTLEKQGTSNNIIYIFSDTDQAKWFHSLLNVSECHVSLSIYQSCVLATGETTHIENLMFDVESKFHGYNQSIIENKAPGWLFTYNTQRNMGCVSIRRQRKFGIDEIENLCDAVDFDTAFDEHKYACEQKLDNSTIAKKMIESLTVDPLQHNLSASLIYSWLDGAHDLIEPASLIDPNFIAKGFIEPIALSTSTTFNSLTLKSKIKRFFSSKQHLRYLGRESITQLFNAHIERTCLCDQNTGYALARELSDSFFMLKTRQIKQALMREYSALCDTGNISDQDIIRPIVKHTHYL